MSRRSSRRGWTRTALAIGAGALIGLARVAAHEDGEIGAVAAWGLTLLGLALFLLFARLMLRGARAALRLEPRAAVFCVALVAVTVVSWGLAFFYPFPVRDWRDALRRDLIVSLGLPLPLVFMLSLALVSLAIDPRARARLAGRIGGSGLARRWRAGARARVGLAVGVLVLAAFLAMSLTRGVADALDLASSPERGVDVLVQYRIGRAGDTAYFAKLGALDLPPGSLARGLRVGERYVVLYTPRAHLLVGIQPLLTGDRRAASR
jgi:hypothetical protein